MNESIIALSILFIGIGLFTAIVAILSKIRRKFRVVATSNTDRADVPDVIIYDDLTYLEAQEYADKMNQNNSITDKYYYFIYRNDRPLKT